MRLPESEIDEKRSRFQQTKPQSKGTTFQEKQVPRDVGEFFVAFVFDVVGDLPSITFFALELAKQVFGRDLVP